MPPTLWTDTSVLHAAEPRWDDLDKKYLAATMPPSGNDLLEQAILIYALHHEGAFAVPAIAALKAPPGL